MSTVADTAATPGAFHPLVRDWFAAEFGVPTPAQELGWAAISSGENALILAPTGSGKTLASFLWSIDRLLTQPRSGPADTRGVRLLYISPLKALNYDIERNLNVPLQGVAELAAQRGVEVPDVRVGVRTGDTKTSTRASLIRKPPEILITTPESLYLMLTAAKAREVLRTVEWVIVDEIHAIAGSKRGTHLAVSLERLADLQSEGAQPAGQTFQRIGLSATAKPPDTIAELLGGYDAEGNRRHVEILDASDRSRREIDLEIDFLWGEHDPATADDRGPREWPDTNQGHSFTEACRRVVELIRSHKATLVFAPSRGQVEQMVQMVNEMAGEELVSAHHGSVARDKRRALEVALKNGEVPGIVCTSSLEMGIDMGPLDCIVQYASPRSAAAGLQRVGRSGHGVGQTSFGRVYARNPMDLLECAAAGAAMAARDIEPVTIPDLCLDVAAQQIVSMVAVEPTHPDDVLTTLRRSAPFAQLSRAQLDNVIAMLEGRYADERYRELSPRLLVDAATGLLHPRRGARRLATLNGGTIPDRGEYAVRIETGEGAPASESPKVGELDEEFVGDLARDRDPFILGASTWRTTRIDHSNVFVVPAPGEPGAVAFWNGENTGRGSYLAKRVAELAGDVEQGLSDEDGIARKLAESCRLTDTAARKLIEIVREQKDAIGSVPSARSIPIEIYRDEIGDLRIVLHSLFGWQVNGAWAHALKPQIRNRYGNLDPQIIWTGDGVIIRLPEMAEDPDLGFIETVTAGNVGELLLGELADAPMFALRFRESAQRALLLPKGMPTRRTPLWLQRQRSADLLSVVRRKEGFPVVQEAVRECYQEHWDLEGLRGVLRGIEAGEIDTPVVHAPRPSPFAVALDYAFMKQFAEDGDAPRGECRAAFLALDRDLLAEVLRAEDLRALLDDDVVAEVASELGRTELDRRARDATDVLALLTDLGDLADDEIAARYAGADAGSVIAALGAADRIVRHPELGRWVVAADRDRSVENLLVRHVAWRGPVSATVLARRYGLERDDVVALLDQQVQSGALVAGQYLPDGSEQEWCIPDVVARLHRLSLARARQQIEPVPLERYAAFLAHRHLGTQWDTAAPALAALENVALPIPIWENAVLPARIPAFDPAHLDAACGDGSWMWWGRGRGLVAVTRRGHTAAAYELGDETELGAIEAAVLDELRRGGGWFVADLSGLERLAGFADDEIAEAFFSLAWRGLVTNDLFGAFRWWRDGRRELASVGGRTSRPQPPGRWQRRGETAVTADAARVADELLARYGVVSKLMLRAERRDGPWIPVYSELKRRVMTGEITQGHFVQGLEGAQFARSSTIDELRDGPVDDAPIVLAGADPANIWGRIVKPAASETWRARQVGSIIVTIGGRPIVIGSHWGSRLATLTDDRDDVVDALAALGRLAHWRRRALRVERFDSGAAIQGAGLELLTLAGFRRSGAAMRIGKRVAPEPRARTVA